MSNLWVPRHLRPARKPVRVVFYKHSTSGRIVVGFPENFPAPHGFEKIVCTTAHEVEQWSSRLRAQEKADEEMTDIQREMIEGPIREYARKELLHLRANARNQINRDFIDAALKRIDEKEKRGKMVRESAMHVEGYEEGH